MTDLHKTPDPKPTAQIDSLGWLFLTCAVAITAVAAMIAYNGGDTMVAKTAISQVAGPHG